jgi:23S rRNA (cytosine1962-C5)-methyltransferase
MPEPIKPHPMTPTRVIDDPAEVLVDVADSVAVMGAFSPTWHGRRQWIATLAAVSEVGVHLPDQLPTPSSKRMAVRITPDATRHVKAGHPWVYDDSITSISHRGAPGDLAVIFDNDRNFMAIGLYDPASPIRIKVLHRGKPAQIDGGWWRAQLAKAVDRRSEVTGGNRTTGYRVVNGESDGFPGLVIDRYADTLVIKLYTTAWIAHLTSLVPAVVETLAPETIVLRLARSVRSDNFHGLTEGMALFGEAPTSPVLFFENGLRFEADVIEGQKTGHFLDQRNNRELVRSMTGGATVLDVFASTGGFSVYAAAGGAAEVTSVDISEPTLDVAARNIDHNSDNANVRACQHSSIVGDAFEVMDRLLRRKQRYDVVIVDPPSFAQRQTSIERALHAYGQLTERAVKLLVPGGLLVQASCSSRVTADEFYATVRRHAVFGGYDLHEVRRTTHAADHPVTFAEGAYLKALFARTTALPAEEDRPTRRPPRRE